MCSGSQAGLSGRTRTEQHRPHAPTNSPASTFRENRAPRGTRNMPVETLPVDNMPVDTMPVDTLPVDTIPVDNMPVETLPVDTMPVDTLPVDTMQSNNQQQPSGSPANHRLSSQPAFQHPRLSSQPTFQSTKRLQSTRLSVNKRLQSTRISSERQRLQNPHWQEAGHCVRVLTHSVRPSKEPP